MVRESGSSCVCDGVSQMWGSGDGVESVSVICDGVESGNVICDDVGIGNETDCVSSYCHEAIYSA